MSKFSNVWVWFAELAERGGSSVPEAARKISGSALADVRFVQTTEIDNTDSPYTATEDDVYIDADATSGAITVNLPAGIDKRLYRVKNVSTAGGNAVTVTPNGTETIDGAAGSTLNAGTKDSNTLIYVASATDWRIV